MSFLKRKAVHFILLTVSLLLAACGPIPFNQTRIIQSDKNRLPASLEAKADLNTLVTGNTTFAFNLYQEIRQNKGNLLFSPYSISQALAMTEAGARGETERQMSSTLKFTLDQGRLHPAFNALSQQIASRAEIPNQTDLKGFKLNVVNALWGQSGYPFQPAFLDTLAENYSAGMRQLDFRQSPEPSRQVINQWVSDQTEKRIQDLIPTGVIDPSTRLVLTNAIYFKAGWLYAFDQKQTQTGDFLRLDGSRVSTPMMTLQFIPLQFSDSAGCQAVELPYNGGQLSMIILVPPDGQFEVFEQGLDIQQLNKILASFETADVNLSMPKFRFESGFDLGDSLKNMGMVDAFDPTLADLSGMTGQRELYITSVLHKAFINVDEQGTEAAAATMVSIAVSAAPRSVEMKVDRPFIFLIWDEGTNSVLFLGRVLDPTG